MELSKYMVVVQAIKKSITEHEFSPGDRIPPEMDLCNIHGVSRQTVRQALNVLEQDGFLERKQGSGTYVSKRRLGKKSGDSAVVGVISTYFSDYIFPEIITGIEEVLSDNDYGMQIALTHNKVKNEYKALQSMLEKNISALIVEPTKSALPNQNMRLYEEIHERGIPLVFFNARYPWSSFPCIALDDVQVGRLAANSLIDTGHKEIAGIFLSDDIQGHLRYKGFMQSLRIAGLSDGEQRVLWYATEDLDDLFQSPARLLARLNACDGVVCYNDNLALRLMEFCKHNGIGVPEDISIVGVDNANPAMCEVPLATIAHPKKRLGQDAASAILTLMKDPSADVERFYTPELIRRASLVDRS